MNDQFAIQTQGLVKSYGKVQALFGVDLKVEKGSIFGFLGPNGAGKTTTIRCLLDLIRPQGGSISVMGFNPQTDATAIKAMVGYLPGELSMESNLKVEGQLRYYRDLRSNHIDWKFVQELAERLKLDLKLSIKNLSKGNKQKIGIVQALMHKPELLLMDEPTTNLDSESVSHFMSLLSTLRADGMGMLISTHAHEQFAPLDPRVIEVHDGSLRAA